VLYDDSDRVDGWSGSRRNPLRVSTNKQKQCSRGRAIPA